MGESTPQLRGSELLRAAVNQILQHPEMWNQTQYHCGSKHCIAGWCELLGTGVKSEDTEDVAREALNLSHRDAFWLFSGERTLEEICEFSKRFSAGYDEFIPFQMVARK